MREKFVVIDGNFEIFIYPIIMDKVLNNCIIICDKITENVAIFIPINNESKLYKIINIIYKITVRYIGIIIYNI